MPALEDRPERWPVAESRVEYDGPWVVRLRDDRIRRPGHPEEEPFSRLVVEHPGAAIVVAVDDRDRVLCLWQYRHAVEATLVQLPAGLLDVAGEDPLDVARRELVEEAGYEVGWVPFADLHEAVTSGRLRDSHLALGVLLAGSRLAPVPRRSGTDHDKEQDS